jgi:hypothetical protein
MASGTTARSRAAYIEAEARKDLSEVKQKHNEYMVTEAKSSFEAQTVRFHPSEVIVARESQEDPQMSTSASVITPKPTPPARPTRSCSNEGCQRTISYNNVSGECRSCQKQSSQRIGIAESTLRHKRQALAKPNGNGTAPPTRGFGSAVATAHHNPVRVDLLLAAIPKEEKVRMLSAWIAGRV